MTDVLIQLQQAKWRGIQFPVSGSSFSFAQENSEIRIIFRDNKLIESLGLENPRYSYQIPFREDIIKGPFQNLFTQTYPGFLNACLDRSAGTLIDPFHGPQRCKCVSLREIRDVNKRDGVDVEVEFMKSPKEGDVTEELGNGLRTLDGAKNAAGLLDQQVKKIDWKQEPSPEPTLDPFDFITSVGDQISVVQNKVNAKLLDVAFRAGRAADTIDRLKNPSLASTRAAALQVQADALRLENTVAIGRARPLRTVVIVTSTTAGAVATIHGMTIEQLLKLNPELARSPLVKGGSEVRVFFDTSAANASASRS